MVGIPTDGQIIPLTLVTNAVTTIHKVHKYKRAPAHHHAKFKTILTASNITMQTYSKQYLLQSNEQKESTDWKNQYQK